MSSAIAVGVSLIGLLGVVFTLGIFVQMLLSFPAMLSSNSQTYVQQQRKLYNISSNYEAAPVHEEIEEVDGRTIEDSWVDMVDEDASNLLSDAESMGAAARRSHVVLRRQESMTRGRTLKRSRRRHSATTWRTVMRVQDARRMHHAASHDEEDGKQECSVGWRSMEWSR